MVAHVEPTGEQLKALVGAQIDGPIAMINLLRYRDRAEYPGGFDAEPCSGREAYQRYAQAVAPKLAQVGGEPVWGGPAALTVIGPPEEDWDDAFIVRYPSKQAFLDMAGDEEYLRDVVPHRTASLADSRLICCPEDGGTIAIAS